MALLKLDSHGADVVALQRALKARGFDPGAPTVISVPERRRR